MGEDLADDALHGLSSIGPLNARAGLVRNLSTYHVLPEPDWPPHDSNVTYMLQKSLTRKATNGAGGTVSGFWRNRESFVRQRSPDCGRVAKKSSKIAALRQARFLSGPA
jgi:hypothetical protein